MEYTHTFEIAIGDINIEGEMIFNHGNEPSIKTTTSMNLSVEQLKKVTDLFRSIVVTSKECGEITKLEINRKPT